MDQAVYSDHEVAKIFQVALRTVRFWFDCGRLSGFREPGEHERRIPSRHLLHFIRLKGLRVSSCETCGQELACVPDPLSRLMCKSCEKKEYRND